MTTLWKWFKRLFLGLFAFVSVFGLLGAIYQTVAGKSDEKNFPAVFAQQAAHSTNHIMITIDGANHISLVERQEHALQSSTVILKVIEAERSGQPLE